MMRTLIAIATIGPVMVTAAPAAAQAPIQVPGSGNSAQVVNNNREQNAGYNNVIGKMDPVTGQPEQAPVKKGKARPAKANEIVAGSALRDSDGKLIGKVDSVDADGAVVASGESKVKVPLVAFGKDDVGLLLGITAAKFQELMTKAQTSAQ